MIFPKRSIVTSMVVAVMAVAFFYLFIQQKLNPGSGDQPFNFNPFAHIDIERIEDAISSNDGVKKFASYEAFQDYVRNNLTSASVNYGYGGDAVAMRAAPPLASGSAQIDFPQEFAEFSSQDLKAEAPGAGSAADYSQTNIQVAGVDEADIIKSDGKFLYIVNGRSVHIVEAYPAATGKMVHTLSFNGQPSGLYIQGNKLVVYGWADSSLMAEKAKILPIRVAGSVFVKVFDVSDKTNPVETRDVMIEGSALQSRMIGDYLYVITARSEYGFFDQPHPLPRILENGSLIGGDPASESFTMPDVYYFPIDYVNPNLTTVSAINIADAGEALSPETFVLDYVQNIYMSPSNLYVTYTKYLDQWELTMEITKKHLLNRLSAEEQKRVSEIEGTPDYILMPRERQAKVMTILERYTASLSADQRATIEKELTTAIEARLKELRNELEKTIIHKIAIDKGSVTYKTSGEVPGYVLNQFAMDEHDGYFRVATTRSEQWSLDGMSEDESYSNVYILDESMKRAGAVEELAKGERIYSVRFMQGRAYMVTFEQVDPLFVIDVSNPTAPHVLGELKIPGFSTYLHPYDDTTLIGLGRNTQASVFSGGAPTIRGIKLSLFDVADVANPKEVAQYLFDDPSIYSPALDDHKAFLFSATKNMIAIPIQGDYAVIAKMAGEGLHSSIVPSLQTSNLAGVAVLNVTKDSLALQGVIDHTYPVLVEPVSDTPGTEPAIRMPYYGYNNAKRALYIEDALYTLSDRYLKMNNLSSLDALATIELPQETPQPYYKGEFIEPVPPAAIQGQSVPPATTSGAPGSFNAPAVEGAPPQKSP